MNHYEHTQKSVFFRWIFMAIAILFWFIIWESQFQIVLMIFCVIILFIIYSFVSLSVVIDEEYLKIKFWYGIYKTKFVLNEILSVKTVKNKWYYGWGIRVWFWTYMIIYNVSGFDAVELVTKDWKIYRIGSDDVIHLERKLSEKIG